MQVIFKNFLKKVFRKDLTTQLLYGIIKDLGGWGGSPNKCSCKHSPLFYYTTKKFLFQVLTKGFCENFTKKVLLIRLTTAGVSWYNKRGIFFFFFLRKKIPRARAGAAPAPIGRHTRGRWRRRRTNVRFSILNSTHHYYNIKKKTCQVFLVKKFIFFFVFLVVQKVPQ